MRQITALLIALLFSFDATHFAIVNNNLLVNLKITPENVDRLVERETFTSKDDLLDLQFTADGQSLLMVSKSGDVTLWDLRNNLFSTLQKINNPVQAVFNPTNKEIACLCGATSPIDNIEIYTLTEEDHAETITQFGPVSDITFNSTGNHLAIAGGWTRDENVIEIWDLTQRQKLISLSNGQWTSKVAFDPTDNALFAAGYGNSIELWDYKVHAKRFVFEQKLPISEVGSLILPIGDLTFNSDGSQLASMSPEGYIWLWDTKSGEMKGLFRDETIIRDVTQTTYSPANSELKFDPNNRLLFAANGETFRIWDISNGMLLRTICQKINHLAFNSEGTLLATADDLGSISVWDIS